MRKHAGRYAALGNFLEEKKETLQEGRGFFISFKGIEDILGFSLPPSAYVHRAWWSNNYNHKKSAFAHTVTKIWERAGFSTEQVDLEGRNLTFSLRIRPSKPAPRTEGAKPILERIREQIQQRTAGGDTGMSEPAPKFSPPPPDASHRTHHPLFGALKGTIRIVGGTDLTKPADAEWGNDKS